MWFGCNYFFDAGGGPSYDTNGSNQGGVVIARRRVCRCLAAGRAGAAGPGVDGGSTVFRHIWRKTKSRAGR